VRRALLLCLLAAGSGCSVRQLERMERWHGGGNLEMDVRAIRRDTATAGATRDTVAGGLELRGQGGPGRVGLALGLDLHLGGDTRGGFAYESALRPLGVGLDLGGAGALAVTAGAGVAGITGQQSPRLRLPLELRLEVDLHPRAHVRMFGELDGRGRDRRAGFALRLGKGGQRYDERWGNGAFLGVIVGERDDLREVGLVVGYGLTDRYQPGLAQGL
jgi:hypothetical protein